MKNILKSSLLLLGMVGLFGIAAEEAKANSFTVVIEKIELVLDANNYTTTRAVVYDPSAGVGEGVTKTVNLFNASEKLGTGFTLRDAPSGTYESMLIHFSNIQAVSTTGATEAAYDILANMITAKIIGSEGSNGVMILGADGDNSANAINTIFGASSSAPMPSIISGGGVFTPPSLDFALAESDIVSDSAGTITVANLPQPIVVASQATDSASRANLLIDVDANTAFTAVAGWSAGASVVTVGLFNNVLNSRPIMSRTFTSPTPVAITTVTFIDPPQAASNTDDIFPIAWIDADSDGKLDVGESFTVHSLTVASNSVQVSGTADVVYTAPTDRDTLNEPAIQYGKRTLTLTMDLPNDVDTADITSNNLLNSSSIFDANVVMGGSFTSATSQGTVTVVYAIKEVGSGQVSRSIVLSGIWGDDSTPTDDTLENGEAVFFALTSTGIASISATTGVSYERGAVEELTIVNIPLLAITTFADNHNIGEYNLHIMVEAGNTVDSAGFHNRASLFTVNETDEGYPATHLLNYDEQGGTNDVGAADGEIGADTVMVLSN